MYKCGQADEPAIRPDELSASICCHGDRMTVEHFVSQLAGY